MMPLDPSKAATLEQEIARWRDLDVPGLQARWKALTGRKAPAHLPKHLLLRTPAYRIQADAFGDLDQATIRFLERLAAGGRQANTPVPLPASRALKPGTLLRREWQGTLHQVEVAQNGFSWSGATYQSLSEVARAHRHPLERPALLRPAGGRMTRSAIPRLRCGIYTRVSTDAGLEQEFNSLDNQREAAEAYIRSQAHEGWRCLPARYDDGGFSGGSLERPALQRLLEDIRAGLVDVVVVYKVDRLTRSLADFAKLVELFDEHAVSFVSVTQSFNTTSSMGRLTLNVLLSFAQFEREVTGERIRDKIAASKKKGIWMGGHVPLGHRVESGKLVVDADEAATVRRIFERYLALGSLTPLLSELRQQGIVTKQRQLASGTVRGGIPFTRGPLGYLLKNRTYLGETVHRGQSYPGEHDPIIPRELFEAVQARLTSQSRSSGQQQTLSQALLMGRLFDDRNNRMTPSHANKAGRRYRNYVSSALHQGRAEEAGSVTRVSASDVESAIVQALRERWPGEPDDRSLIEQYLERAVLRPATIKLVLRSDSPAEPGDTDSTLTDVPPDGSDAQEDRSNCAKGSRR